jgi:hypothetical protein
MNGRGSSSPAGIKSATPNVRTSEFRFGCVPTGPGVAATTPGHPFCAVHSARALSPTPRSAQYPHAGETPAAAWRILADSFRARHFLSEAEAQRRTLRGPGLPHHRRHPLTADEALAGIVLALVCGGGLVYLVAKWLA